MIPENAKSKIPVIDTTSKKPVLSTVSKELEDLKKELKKYSRDPKEKKNLTASSKRKIKPSVRSLIASNGAKLVEVFSMDSSPENISAATEAIFSDIKDVLNDLPRPEAVVMATNLYFELSTEVEDEKLRHPFIDLLGLGTDDGFDNFVKFAKIERASETKSTSHAYENRPAAKLASATTYNPETVLRNAQVTANKMGFRNFAIPPSEKA